MYVAPWAGYSITSTRCPDKQPQLELLCCAPYSPHDNPVERIWPGRLRQIHSYFRNHSAAQMLDTTAPWTSPWLPPRHGRNFWSAA